MNKTIFTPGPWECRTGTSTGMVVIAPNQPKVRFSVAGVGGKNRIPNAHLIAAAPELYEALVRMKQWCEDEVGAELPCDSIDSALAKARGEV